MEGIKYDAGKPRCSLLPPAAMFAVSRVLTYGATKYSDHNYRKGMLHSRLSDAALRHMLAYLGGENSDPDTHESHVAHAAASLLMLLQLMHDSPELDDRFKTTKEKVDASARSIHASLPDRCVSNRVDGCAVDAYGVRNGTFVPQYGC